MNTEILDDRAVKTAGHDVDGGATAVEYSIMLAAIAAIVIAIIFSVGGQVFILIESFHAALVASMAS